MTPVNEAILMLGANRVWRTYQGGRILDEIEGKSVPEDTHFPEDWIGSLTAAKNPDREFGEEGISRVTRSNGESILLTELIAENPSYYLGQEHYDVFGLETRILTKFLDSAIRLHFQVHPTASFSEQFLGCTSGKTEAYFILAIREGTKNPYIYAGFQRPPERADLKGWIENQEIDSIEACFDKIPVKPGDVFLIPGGFPHALGEGILMVELMEASDLAVRFEFERGGFVLPEEARFLGKDLDFALTVFDHTPVVAEKFQCHPEVIRQFPDGSEQRLFIGKEHTNCFFARETLVKKEITKEESEFHIVIVTEGEGRMTIGERSWDLKLYDRFFVSAACGPITFETSEGLRLLECSPPDPKK
ncbi:class I mannose-6-phosphate isomerase [Akkermansiaceae bacterium]|nr:class I mannose-6-phosphate isomerase [Akkermansiaceae bacterium]